MANKLKITGTADKVYDLDQIAENSRIDSSKPLLFQVYEYTQGMSPNPSNIQVGSAWISKKVKKLSTSESDVTENEA